MDEQKFKEEKKEESEEEYQIITEDYCSSPKCGIKSQSVKNVTKNITFSPVEISMNPYFKYSVFQIKEEQKNDIFIIETNQTKTKDEQKKSSNFINQNNNDIKIFEKETKEEKEKIKELDESNYIHIIEKKSSELTVDMPKKFSEINKKLDKENNKHKKKKYFQHSLKGKDNDNIKMKLNLRNKDEPNKNKYKNTQKNIYNILNNIVIQENNQSNNLANNIKLFQTEENIDKDMNKLKSIFNVYSLAIKKEKSEKIKKEKIKKYPSLTTKNIKRIKKSKKFQENYDINKLQSNINRQHSFIPLHKDKKIKNYPSLIINNDINKESKNLGLNIINNAENKSKSKKLKNQQKMKSLVEKNNNFLIYANKKFEQENCGTPKRRINWNFKLKMDESFKDSEHNTDVPRTTKGNRKISFFDNNIENRRKRALFTADKKDGSLFNFAFDSKKNLINKKITKKKSIFCNQKDKGKEQDKYLIKEKDKKNKTKKKRSKQKGNKDKKNAPSQMIKKPSRREKSFTVLSLINKNLIEDELNINIKENNNNESFNSSKSKSNIEENAENNQKKNSTGLNTSNNKLNRSGVRQNSTRDLIRESNNKEKITALTNKQTIENINEYIRQCLEIIPDLLELGDKMPRIKTRVNPNFPKDKKIALFDLDETIVHCIGEKNINNIESLSRQSDAKIKVCLPGGKKEVTVGINIRPHWKEALNKIKKKYHIIAFTASHESYADSVLNYLDPDNNYFEYRLYRCHCVLCVIEEMKFYVKDLKILEDNYDLKDVVIIDNSVLSFAYHLDNGIPISPFYDSKDDSELLDIADFLLKYGDENDIRDKLKEVYKLNQYLEILKNYSSNENEDSSDSVDEEENNGEKTNKNININKNSSNINLNHPLIENKIKIDINNKNENKDVDENDNKNISQVNLKLKEISELFTNNDKKEKSDNNIYHKPKFIEHQATDSLNKNIDNYRNTKKEKHKTIRFDFNFKKEWDKKQKELKNQ